MHRILILLFAIFSCGLAAAQGIATGTWRYHMSYAKVLHCEAVSNYIYASSRYGFFKVDKGTGEMIKITPYDGINDLEIVSLDYHKDKDLLLIGYANGNIDLLLHESAYINVPGFKNKLQQGDKSILHVNFDGKMAYLSTNFGILELDLDKAEIRNSYTDIGPGGTSIAVYATAIKGDSIFAGTATGILAAYNDISVNLNNSESWKKVYNGKACRNLQVFGDTLYFESDSNVHTYAGGVVKSRFAQKMHPRRIKVYNNKLVIFRGGKIISQDAAGQMGGEPVNILQSGTMDRDGQFWFCTGLGSGVIYKKSSTDEIGFEPNGPADISVYDMSTRGPLMFCTGGGVTSTFGNAFNVAGFYIYDGRTWHNNLPSVHNQGVFDFTYSYYNPKTRKNYLGTHSRGMLEFDGLTAVQRYDNNNSSLMPVPGIGYVRVSGISSDTNGNLWLLNQGGSNVLHTRQGGTWLSYNLLTDNASDLVIDKNGYKWMILRGSKGVKVFSDNGTPGNTSDDKMVDLVTTNGLLTNDVISLAVDENNWVWIGTTQGLNVATNTRDIFIKPKVEQMVIKDVDGTPVYLLGENSINDICVDGGNRKWFATNNGVVLVEADGQAQVLNFTEENSPLPSNKVRAIGQQDNGEMFFGTEQGMVSYKSDASTATEVFGKIKVYPNPVRPGYSGSITIEGLAMNAEVRITDPYGMLVYQTTANGGTATWNGYRLDGGRPNSGVYYVFGINKDGTETAMGKFIFMK